MAIDGETGVVLAALGAVGGLLAIKALTKKPAPKPGPDGKPGVTLLGTFSIK